jgi:hypothetical protein
VNFLTQDVVHFVDTGGCIACHRQGAALYGLSRSKAGGFTVDTSATTGIGAVANQLVAFQSGGSWGGVSNDSYGILGLAGYDAYVTTAYANNLVDAVDFALTIRNPDNVWTEDGFILPVNWGDIPATARIMIGLKQAKLRVDGAKAAA